jgi:hypothetical protein
MSERGILRLVIEGEDAQLFHEGLMELIAESKENPNYRIEDPSGELYWCVGEGDEDYKHGETTCIDCYSSDDRYKGSAVLHWDSYEWLDSLLKLTAEWHNTVEVINLGFLWIDDPDNYFFEFQSFNWGIGTNDAEAKHFEKIIEVIEYDVDEVPDDLAKDWDNLTFDERIALCEKYDVIYMATRVITVD